MNSDVDVSALRRKYAEERDKRVRSDGIHQYGYLNPALDPGAEPIEREPLHDEVDVVIAGGGLGGLNAGARLREAGLEKIRIIDRASDFGGTWYWNRYPGAQCDIESYIYMPLLEELGYIPTEKYAYQPEIFAHCQAIGRHYDLYADACFQTEVVSMTWDEQAGRWIVVTNRDDRISARFVVVACGFLQRPKLPAIPGIEDFEGTMFHTSRWDYEFTGGGPGPDGHGLPKLADKAVGLIGTGATALQAVPPLGASAKELYVFQRTPSAVLRRNNRPTDMEWASRLEPGWQYDRMNNFTELTSGLPYEVDEVQDEWTTSFRRVVIAHGAGLIGSEQDRSHAEEVDMEFMEVLRQRVADTVRSPEKAEALKPYFRFLCKRPGYHDLYLDTFNRPNVSIVDTGGKGVDKVTPTGLIANGTEYALDCIVLATGFDTGRGPIASHGVTIVGRDGVTLADHWGSSMRTFHGIQSFRFPNCFFIGTTQTAGAVSFVHNIVEQTQHVGYIVKTLLEQGASVVEATEEAEEAWVQTAIASVPQTHVDFLESCTPGYYNNEGSLEVTHRFGSWNVMIPPTVFFGMLRQWRDDGDMAGVTTR